MIVIKIFEYGRRMFFLFYLHFILMLSLSCFGQTKHDLKQSFSFHFGYGAAGSFFVRSYIENELPFETSFFKKNFIGKNLNIGFDKAIGKKLELSFNYCLQEFNKKINYRTQIDNVQFIISNHSIRHTNNLYDLTLKRKFLNPASSWLVGIGLFYLRPVQQEILIDRFSNGTLILIEDRDQKTSRLNEGGSLIELSYEKKFQPKVAFGIKSQFYFTISAGTSESITLFPYIKILF